MKWDPEAYKKEYLNNLRFMAPCKYDEYQQFFPGRRFVESLALWLKQFSTKEERIAAYDLVKRNLIFISIAQMDHFIEMCYPDLILPILTNKLSSDSLDRQLHVK